MYCLGCGYRLVDKNKELNQATFIKKNTKDQWVRCPFCGLQEPYLSEQKSLVGQGFASDVSLKKMFRQGMLLEKFNGQFYQAAEKLTKDEALKNLFKSLANVEFAHSKIHQRLGGFLSSEDLRTRDYSHLDTDEKLLVEAQSREKHAIKFYTYAASKIHDQAIKKMLISLGDVEKEHAQIAEISI